MRIAEPRIDVGREAGFLEIRERRLMTPGIDLDRRQSAAGLGECPRHPHARVPRGRPDLEGLRVLVLEDQIVKNPAVTLRDIEVLPGPAMAIEERLDGPVQLSEAILCLSRGDRPSSEERGGSDGSKKDE